MVRLRDIELDIDMDNGRSLYRSWSSMIIWCAVSYTCMLVIFAHVCFPDFSRLRLGLLPLYVHGNSPALFYAFSQSPKHFSKPKGIEIVALVPFHQPRRMEILDCYLRRNLASNGGFLDRVVFIPRTNHTKSLGWLTSRVDKTPSYSTSGSSNLAFGTVDEDVDTLFVWIDGGVVFLEDHTIPTMVKTKLNCPDSLIVSANVINQAALEHLHSHPSIALPYNPELQPAKSVDHDTWRVSALPRWKGPAGFQVHKGFSPPFKNHRWLPSDDEGFDRTPTGMSIYSDDGPGLGEWTAKAQQHYSFMHHLDMGDLHRYKFPIWTNPTEPISTAFFCFMSSDTKRVESFMQPNGPDDTHLEAPANQSHGTRDIIIDGKGLAVHYDDLEGLEDTDVLQRYQSYAREMVCPSLT
ncbi:hypothetical protein BDW62DRAFT_203894 [Aspergillus aurantiobrunneus]